MSLLKTYLTEYPWSLRLETADWHEHGERLAFIEKSCFDEQMRSQAYDLKGLIDDDAVLAMVLFKKEKLVGYIAGAALESESSSFDPASDPKEGWGEFDTIYVDNVSILSEFRDPDTFKFMVSEYIRFGKKMGYRRATMHARKSNGLSAYCIRKLKFKRLKTFKNWYNCGEDFDYLVLSKELGETYATLPAWHGLIIAFRSRFHGSMLEKYCRGK